MLKDKKITIIGSGTMGKIIISGLLKSEKIIPENIIATDRFKEVSENVSKTYGVRTMGSNIDASRDRDIIILAVKPQDMGYVINNIKDELNENTLIISIAAGISTSFIENLMEKKIPVLRAMPNTPCLVGNGMTVISRGKFAKEEHANYGHCIFTSFSKCIELEEKHMNAVTGLSASGPAFIYLIIEALADGGVMMGLPRKVAQELVIQTVLGATSMLEQTDKHPASLKDDVTTPAGCTISGILTLEDGKIRSVLARAVQIATLRAGELGK